MFNPLMVIIVFCVYMIGLFIIALLVERRTAAVKNLVNNPVIYSLGMAVYCTAWTYYGSVGKAATSGMLFLTIYLGPTLTIIFWFAILRKLVRIKSTYRITSIADFISARYNKSPAIAALATAIAFIGTMPYIALQFKAIFSTFRIITENEVNVNLSTDNMAYIVVGLMILFTIIFGIRRLDPTERHQGMMVAVAIENTVQLVAFLIAGIFVCFFLYNGFGDILRQFANSPFRQGMKIEGGHTASFIIWGTYLILAMSAIICLPRQFHTTVVENTDEKHIRTAMWLFPLYMFLINIFVLPIAMSGLLKGFSITQADQFVLLLPLYHGNPWIALVVFLGGFSAATSMIMISSMTMATMITNHLLLPLVDWFKGLSGIRRNLLRCRWIAAAAFIATGFGFERLVGESYMLVNIGLISFAAALQFAPVILGGIFWRRANKSAAIMGLSAGFIVWCYTLLVPSLVKSGWIPHSLIDKGPWGITFLNPEHLFGVVTLDPLSHGVFWSMLFNIGFFVIGSFYLRKSEEERIISEEFIDILEPVKPLSRALEGKTTVDLETKIKIIRQLLNEFFSASETELLIERCFSSLSISGKKKISVMELAEMQNEAEKLLAGAVGTASAHKAIKEAVIFTPRESKELSTVYAEILASLKVTPQELKRKVDYYQERAELLTGHARELADKIQQLEKQILERKKAEEALQEERRLFIGGRTVVFKWKNEQGWPIEYVSPNVKGQFGYSTENLIDREVFFASLIHPDDLERVREEMKTYSLSEVPFFEQEYRIVKRDGEYRWVYDFTVVMKDVEGNPTNFHSYLSDITDRKIAEEALKESEEHLKTLLYSIPAGVMVVDAKTHKIVYANTNVVEMTGIPQDQLIGSDCHRVVCPEEAGECPVTDLGRKLDKCEHALLGADGTLIPILKSVTSVVLEGRECLIESFLDITERKKAEEKLKEAMELKLKFVSMVSHELRTPLTAIKEGISIVLSGIAGELEERQKEFLDDVKKSVDRLARLINDVLDFQKIESKKMGFLMREHDINDIVEEACSIMGPLANDKKMKLIVELDRGLPRINFDKDRIIQVLTNLIDNAVKFTESGSITVGTFLKKTENCVCVSVYNTGEEIKKEDMPRLFRKFEQLELSGKRKAEGTGLGLVICKEIIEEHRGKIWVESGKGSGTTFYFTLPLQERKI